MHIIRLTRSIKRCNVLELLVVYVCDVFRNCGKGVSDKVDDDYDGVKYFMFWIIYVCNVYKYTYLMYVQIPTTTIFYRIQSSGDLMGV